MTDLNDPDPDHACAFVRHSAVQSMLIVKLQKQIRAADHRNRRLAAERCEYNITQKWNGRCIADNNRPCNAQCVDVGARLINAKVVRR